jgi:ComF family protein
MARLYAERRSNWLREAGADLVVPVPMHWARRFQRGVNSPELMARELARFLGVEVGLRALARRRRTAPQADLSPRQRFRNVRDAFRVRASYDIQGRSVLLVDDILTTGATSSEAARMLKEAGAARVVVAVLARAAGPEGR